MKLSEQLDALAKGWFEDTAKPLADAARELEASLQETRNWMARNCKTNRDGSTAILDRADQVLRANRALPPV